MRRVFAYISIFGLALAPMIFGAQSIAQTQSGPPGTENFDPRHPPTQTRAMAGESLFDVAERTRSPIRGIIDENQLVPPYRLNEGQIIKLPPLKVHIVQRGERFEAIARRYSVDMRSLAVFNSMKRPYTVRVGQRIILPALVTDSLTGLEPQDLVSLLAIEISAGNAVSGASANPVIRRSNVVPNMPVLPNNPNAPIPKAPIPKTTPTPNVSPPSPPAPAAMAGRFSWPVRGRIVETFGEKPGFRKVDGIEIGADENTPFTASADGTVAYVGNRLAGYGWLVLVRHPNDYITAYAYAAAIDVHEGDAVRKGQILGRVGKTGRASTPRLHFQIRMGTTPVDPMRYLPRA